MSIAQKMKPRTGLFLWAVRLYGTSTSLWITTRFNRIQDALEKVPSAAKSAGIEGRVRAIEAHGTLDA